VGGVQSPAYIITDLTQQVLYI